MNREKLKERVKKDWDILGLLADLREQKWFGSEPHRIDRVSYIGSYGQLRRLTHQAFPKDEWDEAAKEHLEDELIEEYLDALSEVVMEATGKDLRREHIFSTMDGEDVFIGQYEEMDPKELREMGFDIGP